MAERPRSGRRQGVRLDRWVKTDEMNSNSYMSAEYAMEGTFSVKSDTYSFGVLLLEIVSGLKMCSPHLIMDFPNLIVYVSIE